MRPGVAGRQTVKCGGAAHARPTVRSGERCAISLGEIAHDPVERYGAEILAGAAPQAHRPLLGLASADHQHVRDLAASARRGSCSRASRCGRRARPGRRAARSRSCTARGVLRRASRRPAAPRACTGASQVGNAPAKCSIRMPMKRSKRAEDRPVDDHRPLGLPVGVDVFELEALRQHGEVELDGGDLPVAPQRVLDVDVDLRAVERAVARLQRRRAAPSALSASCSACSASSHCSGVPRYLSGAGWQLERRLRPKSL